MENAKRTSEARFFSRESIMNLFRYRKRRKNVMYYKIQETATQKQKKK